MKIKLYLSKQGYNEKPDKNASIIKTINRRSRKAIG